MRLPLTCIALAFVCISFACSHSSGGSSTSGAETLSGDTLIDCGSGGTQLIWASTAQGIHVTGTTYPLDTEGGPMTVDFLATSVSDDGPAGTLIVDLSGNGTIQGGGQTLTLSDVTVVQPDPADIDSGVLPPGASSVVFSDAEGNELPAGQDPSCNAPLLSQLGPQFAGLIDAGSLGMPMESGVEDSGDAGEGEETSTGADAGVCASVPDGTYCGGDQVAGSASTLYTCAGGSLMSSQPCDEGGCQVNGSGTDACN